MSIVFEEIVPISLNIVDTVISATTYKSATYWFSLHSNLTAATLSENDDREININNCNREGVYYLNNGYLELILGIEQALATIEEMEKL